MCIYGLIVFIQKKKTDLFFLINLKMDNHAVEHEVPTDETATAAAAAVAATLVADPTTSFQI
jgi:hypothetical protein